MEVPDLEELSFHYLHGTFTLGSRYVIYGLTATYEKILMMFSTSCLPDNGKHNITKEKKNFRA